MSRAGLRFLCVASASVAALAAAASCGFPTVTFAPDSTASGGGGGATSTTSSISMSTSTHTSSSSSSSETTTTSSHAGAGGNGGNGGSGGDTSTSSSGGATGTGGAGGGCCDCDGDGHDSIECGGDDCADHDARAHPGQTMFFSSPIMGPTSAGTQPYDFNCDGSETFHFQTVNSCSGQLAGSCTTAVNWTGTPPDCGMSGDTAHCVSNGLGCKAQSDGSRVQACN